jgi:hypothetical protein
VPHGELLQLIPVVDVAEFLLVAVLGFMPLIVIHWADRRPHIRLSAPKRASMRFGILKASLLVMLTDWALVVAW